MDERSAESGQANPHSSHREDVASLHVSADDSEKTAWTTIGLSSMAVHTQKRVPIMPRRTVKEGDGHDLNNCDYQLERVLGEGGMGVVYEARQNNLGRSVALKRLRLKDPDGHLRAPFLAEAAITGRLDHPNIVPIHDVGIDDNGVPFYTMKQVTGQPWSERLRHLPRQENLEILMRVADAVAYSHDMGIIHRDLKPENVMLGNYGEVLVTDWGLAVSLSEVSQLSLAHAVGTPGYMAPELAWGDKKNIGIASDIYLLGACLYNILIGEPPHPGVTAREAIHAAAYNVIEPPIPAHELGRIAERAMETDPRDRFQTVREFQQAIRDYRIHESSMQLLDQARSYVERARASKDQTSYARAVHALEESIKQWPHNHNASALLKDVCWEYANHARQVGDLELANSLLDEKNIEHQLLLEKITGDRAVRKRSRRRVRILSFLSMGMAVLVCVILVIALLVVNRQFAAVLVATTQRQDAEARLLHEESRRAVSGRWSPVFSDDLNDLSRMGFAGARIDGWNVVKGAMVAEQAGARILLPETNVGNIRVQFDLLSGSSIRFLIGRPAAIAPEIVEKMTDYGVTIDVTDKIRLQIKGQKIREIPFPTHLVGFSHRIRVEHEGLLISMYVNGQQVLVQQIDNHVFASGMSVELESVGDYSAIDHIRIDHLK